MASSCDFVGFLAFMLLAAAVSGHWHDPDISPSLSNYTDKICEDVECGKGKCKVDLDYRFNFRCECESGWKRTRLSSDDGLQFLPCTIPDCSLDYSCMPAASPAPAVPHNESTFDPCYWTYCGEGTCKRIWPHKHICECRPGFDNLLNISFYPCYSDCALGHDCERLGIKVADSTSSTPSGGSRATSFLHGNLEWVFILLGSTMAVALH